MPDSRPLEADEWHGPALNFAGKGYVSIPGDNFRNLRSGTVSVWIRPTSHGTIISTLHETSNNRQFPCYVADPKDGTFCVGVTAVTKEGRSVLSLHSDNRFSLNAWHHVVFSSRHGSGKFDLYVDGKPQPMHVNDPWCQGVTDFFYADVMQGSDGLQLGSNSDSQHVQGDLFPGAMRDLMIFDEAFSQEQVTALYAAGGDRRSGIGDQRSPRPPTSDLRLPTSAWMSHLVAGYHFDEGRGTTIHDFSGFGNDGTLHGGATWEPGSPAVLRPPTSELRATALHFDGTGYVRIPGGNFRNLRSGTVSVWIRPAAGGYILSSLTDMSNNRQGGLSLSDNGDGTFSVHVGEVSKDNRYVFSVVTDNHFRQNAWHHLVYTSLHGSGTCDLYIDGKLQPMHFWQAGNAVDFFFADLMQSGDDLQLGATSDEHHVQCGFFQGQMRDLLIFDEPFSQEQVPALHAAGPGGDLSQYAWMSRLIAGYHLDEGRGTMVRDFSGNGNTGTLGHHVPMVGGVTWVSGRPAAPHADALHFDGDRYATLPQSTKFTAGDFTISLWFDPTSADRSQYLFMRGFGNRDQQGDIGLRIEPSSQSLLMMARTDDSRWLFDWTMPGPRLQGPVKVNQWNHVVVTRRGDTYSMWMNGKRRRQPGRGGRYFRHRRHQSFPRGRVHV